MKWSFIILLIFYSPDLCFCQPVSWFAGAGPGITKLRTNDPIAKASTNTGRAKIIMAGLDIPLQESLRSTVRATLTGYRAFFHTKMEGRGLIELYSVHFNAITPEISYLYNVINAKIKLFLGVGIDINVCWNNYNHFKMTSSQFGFVYTDKDDYISPEPCWPSFNVKTGIKVGKWELGATGYLRGIIAWNDIDILNADVFYIFLGYHFRKK